MPPLTIGEGWTPRSRSRVVTVHRIILNILQALAGFLILFAIIILASSLPIGHRARIATFEVVGAAIGTISYIFYYRFRVLSHL